MDKTQELLNKALKILIDQSDPRSSEDELLERSDKMDNYDDSSDAYHYNFWDGTEASESHLSLNNRTFLKEHFDIDISNPDLNASFRLLEINPEYYKLIKIVQGNGYSDVLNKLNAKSKLLTHIE